MIRPLPPVVHTPVEFLETKAQALAARYEQTVVKGVPEVAKQFGSFVPFAGATERLSASSVASIIVGFNAGGAEARFMLDNTPVSAAQLSAAASDEAAFSKWMHTALFMADVRLKSAARRQR